MKSIKRDLLTNLSREMAKNDDGGLGEMLKGKKMQKVMVASDSKEGLEEGLSKAQEIMKKREIPMEEESEEECGEEMEDEEGDEEEAEETPEEIQAQIAALQAKLAKK